MTAGGLAALVALEVAILNAWAFAHNAPHDGWILVAGAERLVAGQVPYRDFFHFFTPGSLVVLAGLFLLFGTSVNTTLLAMVLLAVGTALGVLALARATGLPRGWSAFAGWLAVNASIVWWPTPSHHWFATLAAIAAASVAARAARTGRPGWALGAGVLLGTTCWFLQSRGALMVGVVGIGLVAVQRASLRPLLAGLSLSALPVLGLLALVPLATLWQDLVVFPLAYYPEVNQAAFLGFDLLPSASSVDPWRKMLQVLAQAGTIWLALPSIGVSLALAIRGRRCGLLIASLAAAAGGASVAYRPLLGHLTFVAPLMVVPLVWLVWRASLRWPMGRALAVVLAGAHLVLFVPAHEAWLVARGFTVSVPTPRGAVPVGTASDAAGPAGSLGSVAAYVAAHTRPGEPIFTYPAIPALYTLLARPNATRYDYLWPGENTPEQFAEAAANLARVRPRLVIWDRAATDELPLANTPSARASDQLMRATVERLYQPVLRAGPFEILRDRAE